MEPLKRNDRSVAQFIRSETDDEFKELLMTIAEKITQAITLVERERLKDSDKGPRPS